jgi:hypothetical protein
MILTAVIQTGIILEKTKGKRKKYSYINRSTQRFCNRKN